MEFGIGWRIMALLVIAQFIGFATALRETQSNVAMSNPDVSLPSTSSGNSSDVDEGVHKNTSKPRMEEGHGTDKSNKTETSFVTKVEHLVCSTVGLLCPDKHNKGSDDKAGAESPARGSDAEKGRNEVGKNSTSVEENKGKDKSSRSTNSSSSSSSNSHSEDKKSESVTNSDES